MASIATPRHKQGLAAGLLVPVLLLLGLLLVLLLGIAAQRSVAALAANGQQMQRSQAAIAALASVQAAAAGAESGRRDLAEARAATDAQLAELRRLLSTDAAQYSRLVTLGTAVAERFDALSAAATPTAASEPRRRASPGTPAGTPAPAAEARRLQDAVQAAVSALQTPAQAAATAAEHDSATAAGRAALWLWLATAAALLLVAVLAAAGWRLLQALRGSRALAADAAAQQRASEANLQHMLTALPGPVCVLDADARVVHANPACLQLWGSAALDVGRGAAGIPFVDTVLPADRRKAQLALDQLLAGGAAAEFRHRVPRADGSTALIAWHAQWSAADAALVCAGSDITELEALRLQAAQQAQALQQRDADLAAATARAQAAESAQSRFLAMLEGGHGLREPLDAVDAMAGVLLQGLSGPLAAEQQRQLQQLRGHAQQVRAAVHDLLDIAQIDAGALVLQREPFDLWDAIQQVATALRPQAQEKGLALLLDLADDLGYARGDERRLQQVLRKLLDNAIRCTATGTITLAARPLDGGMLAISVADTGAGIAAADIGLLFEPFRQHPARAAEGGMQPQPWPGSVGPGLAPGSGLGLGLGLGLAIAQRLARQMGGQIAVASGGPGRGSTFTLTLPSDTAAAAASARG